MVERDDDRETGRGHRTEVRRDSADGPDEALRQVHRGGRDQSRGAPGRAVRTARAQRRRQDHDHPHDRRDPPADQPARSRSAGVRHSHRIRSRPSTGSGSSPTDPSSTTSSPAASFSASPPRCTARRVPASSAGSTSCWSCSSSVRWKDELTESYSHGMRQKLIISGALVHRPEVIVVDEPMVGLDPKSARLLKDLFRQFVDRGGTVLMSTHTLEVAEPMCDRIAIVLQGKDRGPRHHGRAAAADRVGRPEPGRTLPQAHRRPARASARRRARSLTCVPGDRPQPALWTLLTPKWRGALARLRQERQRIAAPSCCWSIIVGGGFWAAVFGDRLPGAQLRPAAWPTSATCWPARCSASILLAFLSILLLSNIITALSTFFLAKDLDLLVAAPVGGVRLYLAKLGETVVHSSWMVALLALPILTAYGIVYSGGPLFPFVALAAFVPFLILPAVRGHHHHGAAGERLPRPPHPRAARPDGPGRARRRWWSCLRFMRPEQLARPEGFKNFVDYLVGAAHADQPLAAERVDRRNDHELAAPRGRSGADRACSGARRWSAVAWVHWSTAGSSAGVLQGAGGRGAQGAPAAARPGRRGCSRCAARHQAGVHAQGPAALLPGQHPVEPADPAGRAADDLPLQHQRRCRSTRASGSRSAW